MSTQILRIPQEAKSTILELASELKFASKSLKKREWLSLILKTASTAGRETLITKVEGIKDLGKYFTKKF